MPLFLTASMLGVVGLSMLTKGALFKGASFFDEGAAADLEKLRQMFVAAIALAAFLSVCVYRKRALIFIALSLVSICSLLLFELPDAFRPPVRWNDIVTMSLIGFSIALTCDALLVLRTLWASRRPGFAHLDGFARLCRERRRRYWAVEPLKLLWLVPAIVIGLAAALLYQLAKAYFILSVLELPAKAFAELERLFEWIQAHPWRYTALFAAEALQLILTIVTFVYAIRFFLPLVRRSAEKVIADGNYQPIVFLRSFRDEEALLRSRRAFDRMTFRKRRLEEIVVRTLAPLGPAVAVGMPGERIPKLGALRAYYPENEWREAVLSWIGRSYVVVVVAGLSPWALWEFNHALVSGSNGRLLLVVPPESDPAARRLRWEKVSDAARGTPWHEAMLHQDPAGLIAVLFGPEGKLICISGAPGEQVDVELAVRIAAGHIAAVQVAAVPAPK